MNFYKTLGLKNSRIDVADALRGLAVAGIILYHSVEHFNMYDGSIEHAYTLGCDDWMADVLALLLSGKITTEAFCDVARELTGADVTNEEIIDAANKMLVEIPDEKKERLLQLKKAGYRLFLLSNTIDIHCRT